MRIVPAEEIEARGPPAAELLARIRNPTLAEIERARERCEKLGIIY